MIAKAIAGLAALAAMGSAVPTQAAEREPTAGAALAQVADSDSDSGREIASRDDCAIFAAIARGEIARPAEPGVVRLPAPRRDISALPSRAERWMAYAEKLNGWDPRSITSYDQWIITEADRLRAVEDFPDFLIGEAVTANGRARPAYRIACDWSAAGVTFVPAPEGEAHQWLVFARPVRVDRGDYAMVDISYGYSNSQARDASCVLARENGAWRLLGCETTLTS